MSQFFVFAIRLMFIFAALTIVKYGPPYSLVFAAIILTLMTPYPRV